MSDIKIQPSATGLATVTLTAPATSTARTVTLPDGTGTIIADNGSGSVGIGTSSPARPLEVKDSSDQANIRLQGSVGYCDLSGNGGNGSDFVVLTEGTEKFRVKESGGVRATDGILFGTDTAAANALDDYEEGTWTPVLTDLTNNATMHSLNDGAYTKIGRVVHCTANVRTTSLGSVSGNLYLAGFPFSTPNINGNQGAGSVANAENMAITAGHAITLYYGKNTNKARFDIYDHSGGVTVLQASEWTSDGQAAIQVTYSI